MAAPTKTDLKKAFLIDSTISDDRLDFCVNAALRDVKRLIGVEAYNQVFSGATSDLEDSEYLDENTTTTDEVAMRLADVTDAVLHFAMAKVITNANLRIRASGQVKREHDTGAPGIAGNQVINEYLTPAEVQAWAGSLTAEGNRLIAQYVVDQEPVESLEEFTIERG